MSTFNNCLLLLFALLVLAPTHTYAFGAGDIPDFAYLNEKAFRHGDIESILENLAKTAGHVGKKGLLGFAASVISTAKGGAKFNRMDIKRVYFGNWLRDYSQAMDIAGLSKLTAETIILVLSALGFMTFGFATEEFQITADRLGVYLPVEHIDNPKGYAEKEGDARQFHSKLRPPVNPRELEIDERTGMKNYMASENHGWDTSTGFIRRTFEACIEHGRRARGSEGADLWEAYRLLGTGLHTLEDLLAHSNWCELALRKMGHEEVFCHVGDNVFVNSPNGRVPPLVTGTFGSADFIHSLLGEATDKMSEASVTNLYDKMEHSGDQDSSITGLQNILGKLPLGGGGGSEHAQHAEDIKAKAYHFDPDKVAPQEVQERLLEILKWHDDVFRDIAKKLEMVPGLQDLLDELTQALNAYVYTVIAPWLTPIVKQVTGVLDEGSKAVIDHDDQFEVFDNPDASDPSHSLLSKDHFGLILNEPAGKIAQRIVEYSVNLIVQAWFDHSDPRQVVDKILEAFHHPYYATGNSQIQNTMMDQMTQWFSGEGSEVIEKLTKDSVRNGRNKREGSGDEGGVAGGGGHSHQGQSQNRPYGSQEGYGSSGQYGQQKEPQGYQGGGGYGSQEGYGSSGQYGQQQEPQGHQGGGGGYGYGGGEHQQQSQLSSNEGGGYGGSGRHEEESYSRPDDNESHGGGYGRSGNEDEGYGGGHRYGRTEEEISPPRRHEDESYGGGYGGSTDDGSGRRHGHESSEPTYGSGRQSYGGGEESYGGHRDEEPTYTRREETSYGSSEHRSSREEHSGYQPSYGGDQSGGYQPSYEQSGYGTERRSHGGDNEETGGYGGDEEYGQRRGDDDSETFGAERLNLGGEGGYGYGRREQEEY